ncbi:transient receptor potential cation channel subfamily M member-like 2 isoform X2 [Convolutriloba macropyga]|uniref:transient receptor potential cation channel subfamily M member-like 2 isoform X2 n=1 Tax=Convolutriloba macropyga TaxID=536237 RepID=UPI003F5243A9
MSTRATQLRGVAKAVHAFGNLKRQVIVNQLHHKECSSFCPVAQDEIKCQCGLIQAYHSQEAQDNRGDNWTSDTCTVRKQIDCYGTLEFNIEEVGIKTSKFVRVANDVDVKVLVRFLRHLWKLDEPSLIISMTGGAFDFKMQKDDLDELKTGIYELATTKNVWTITGGTDAGIMKICGDAVKDHTISTGGHNEQAKSGGGSELALIGVATWGAIANNQLLVPSLGDKAPLRVRYHVSPGQMGLNPNHTHFVLVDDGSTGFFGREQELRGLLEKELCKRNPDDDDIPVTKPSDQSAGASDSGVSSQSGVDSTSGGATVPGVTSAENEETIQSIPIVSLMVEGGPGTIDTVRNSLKTGAPCVVIGGSGRGASLLEASCDKFDEQPPETDPRSIQADIKQLTEQFLGGRNVDKNVEMIMECLDFRKQIRVFQLDADENATTSDLDKAVLSTLLNTGTLSFEQQLEFALLWDRPDMLRDIFDANMKQNQDKRILEKFFFKSLVDNRAEFVAFLADKVNFKTFLTKAVLDEMYQKTLDGNRDCFLLAALEQHSGTATNSLYSIDSVIEWLHDSLDFSYMPTYTEVKRPGEILITQDKIEKPFQENSKSSSYKSSLKGKVEPRLYQADEVALLSPERSLFIYALLFLRYDLALFFWELMPSKIAASLSATAFCSRILETFHIKTHREEEEVAQLMRHTFQERAVGVLGVCHSADPVLTEKILESSHKTWGVRSAFEIAQMTFNIEFISQSACQSVIQDRWMGGIANQTPFWQLVLCSFFPPFIGYMIWFKFELEQIRRSKDWKGDATRKISKRDAKMPVLLKWKAFYAAPVTTFILHFFSNLIFIGLFCYMVLQKIESSPSVVERILIGWTLILNLQIIKDYLSMSDSNVWRKAVSLGKVEAWSRIDFTVFLTFLAGVILRAVRHDSESALEVTHLLYVFSLMCYIIRVFGYMALSDTLGPQIEMCNKMLYDMMYFTVILFFVIFAYGIAVQALMYPGENEPFFSVVWGILISPYFEMVGNLNFQGIGASSTSKCDASVDSLPYPYEVCPDEGWKTRFSVFLKMLYILISNVMLLNVLIALFNYRFTEIQEMSQEYWKYARFLLTREYANKSELPPPVNIIQLIYYVIRAIVKREMPRWQFIKRELKTNERNQVHKWEDLRAAEYLRRTVKECEENVENKVSRIEKRLAKLHKSTQNMEASMKKMGALDKTSDEMNHGEKVKKVQPVVSADTKKLESEMAAIKASLARLEALMIQKPKSSAAGRQV